MTENFTETLRNAASDQWERIICHKFTTELARGTISRKVLLKYLIQDHRFLDAFVILLSSVVSKARCLEDRIEGCQFLAVITGKENTYFERCFSAFNCTKEDREAIPNAQCTTDFINLMLDVSRNGSLGEMLSVLVVCEWTYLEWGRRVNDDEKIVDRSDFVTYEWVDLHCGDYFESVVKYLRSLLDKEGQLMTVEEQESSKRAFLKAVQLEEDFFNHAYT